MASFLRQVVDPERPDGYWLEPFPFSVKPEHTPDLIGYGLGTTDAASVIQLYLNPYNRPSGAGDDVGWQKRKIAELRFPVACSHADISGNGFNDAVLSDGYGSSLYDIWPDGGRVSWFENTGDHNNINWTRRYIGKSPGMHRLKAGHFSTKDAIQIIAAPVVVKSADFTTPAPMIVYTAPREPAKAKPDSDEQGWPSEIVAKLRLVHDVFVVPSVDGGLDKILFAGREGITVVWYDSVASKWESENIGTGLPETVGSPFWGSSSVGVGKVGDDSAGYIGAAEAFHGNHVVIYAKDKDAPANKLFGVTWTRHVLEDFGPLNEHHTGSIHHVICADIDNDGVDELLVAMMGSDPASWNKTGVWCYKPIDIQSGKFSKFKLSDDSAARIALGDFTGRGLLDYSTISYSVPGYFEAVNPAINLFANATITAEKLNDEVLFRIPQPASTRFVDEVEFLDVSSRKLSLVVVPPKTKYRVSNGVGLKVIAGQVYWEDHNGKTCTRTQATDPFAVVGTVVQSKHEHVTTGSDGAAFVLMKESSTSGKPPYSDMKQLVAHNIFPDRFSPTIRKMTFPWVKVEDRPWANGRFKDVEFYNLVGFHVRFADDSDKVLCHIQLWTAGVGVSAGFHNHTDATFCEIHACIVNGTGKGGMSWATVPDDRFNPDKPDPTQYKSIVVGDMSEHGPLWRAGETGLPDLRHNGTVDYPWHAWIAGPGDPQKQSFDVWVAFEFPPLITRVMKAGAVSLEPGTYTIHNASHHGAAVVKGGDSKDGTPIEVMKIDHGKEQQWEISKVPGTIVKSLKNLASGSFATSSWPLVVGQRLVGSRSLAILGITSSWVLTATEDDCYKIWLIGSNMVWSHGQDNSIVLKEHISGEASQKWKIETVPK